MTEINDDMIAIWRENYGLNGRTPMEAMDYWLSGVSGMAPAGAVCALGIALDHIDQLRAELDEQGRLLGMGSEREARLTARVAELERWRERMQRAMWTPHRYAGMCPEPHCRDSRDPECEACKLLGAA